MDINELRIEFDRLGMQVLDVDDGSQTGTPTYELRKYGEIKAMEGEYNLESLEQKLFEIEDKKERDRNEFENLPNW
jgi:hypothetical protein